MTQSCSVIINGRFLDQPITGVQRYARGICGALDEMIAEDQPIVSGLDISVARPRSAIGQFPYQQLPEERFGRLSGHAWEQLELPLWASSAIIVNLCNVCPILGRRNLTVVHDANVWLIPENYSPIFRLAYRSLIPIGIRRSAAWVTVSQYSADQLVKRHIANRPPDAIVGNGADHMHAADGNRPVPKLPIPFVFALGSRSRNKNIDMIRSLSAPLQDKGISVVIAGDAKNKIFADERVDRHPNVIELGRIDDDDLAHLFRNCLCFLFPSYFEGFGVPPIEAMALGAPVISSNTSSLPEILGDAALYCPPNKPSLWIEAIMRLFSDSDLRTVLVSNGQRQASKYRWRLSAERLIQLVRPLLPR